VSGYLNLFQGFNGDDFSFMALLFGGNVHKDFPVVFKNVRPASIGEQRPHGCGNMVIRWSKDIDVIFITFDVFCTYCELLQ
jgi:hypothetical protein